MMTVHSTSSGLPSVSTVAPFGAGRSARVSVHSSAPARTAAAARPPSKSSRCRTNPGEGISLALVAGQERVQRGELLRDAAGRQGDPRPDLRGNELSALDRLPHHAAPLDKQDAETGLGRDAGSGAAGRPCPHHQHVNPHPVPPSPAARGRQRAAPVSGSSAGRNALPAPPAPAPGRSTSCHRCR